MTSPPTRTFSVVLTAAALAAATSTLAGCISDDPSKPAGLGSHQPPSDPKIARLVLTARFPRDTNANGYPDSMTTLVRLFEEEPGWPLALAVPGTFKFEMLDSQKKLITTWAFDASAAQAAATRDATGVCYQFDLSLLEGGRTDQLSTESVDVRATFTPTKGGPSPNGTVSQHFGRTR